MRNVIEYDGEGEPEYDWEREPEYNGEMNAVYVMGSVIKYDGELISWMHPLYTCTHHICTYACTLYRPRAYTGGTDNNFIMKQRGQLATFSIFGT